MSGVVAVVVLALGLGLRFANGRQERMEALIGRRKNLQTPQ